METSILDCFPAPIDGETVYSWLSRYHLWSGHNSFRTHTLSLFGVKTGQAAAEFPSFIKELAALTGVNIDWIVEHMTDCAFYLPFLTSSQYQSTIQSIKQGNTTSLQTKLGVIANRVTPGKELWCCPLCVQVDTDNCGFPFWHVEHQIVGLVSCPRHNVKLISTRKIRSKALQPSTGEVKQSTDIADRYSQLILSEFQQASSLDKLQLILTYQTRLKELGLLTECHHLRLNALKGLLTGRVSQMAEYSQYQLIQTAIGQQYPECLFYTPQAQHHPLKHLILIEALFGDWVSFLQRYAAATEIVGEDVKERQQFCIELTSNMKHLLKSGISMRYVAKEAGHSVTTIKALAQQSGISIDTRPQKIFKFVERSIWRKLFVGFTCPSIASELGISVAAVEQILRKHPYLKPLRKVIWFHQEKVKHRHQLIGYFAKYPTNTLKQFRSDNSATFMWLYRHDGEWLAQHLPKQVKRIYWPRKAKDLS